MWHRSLLIFGLAFASCEVAAETLATVNGVPVTRERVQQELQLQPELAKQPDADKAMLESLIAGELLVQEAKTLKLDQVEEVKREIEALARQVLANAAVNRRIAEHPVSEDEIKAGYEEFTKANANEYHIRHILVKTEEEARTIRDQIKGSDDFTGQAKQHSLDMANAKQGGEVGWYAPMQVVKPFGDAMAKLQKGEISQPVQTQHGWHIIELLDTRPAKLPSLEESRERITRALAIERINLYITQLRAKAKITRP